LSDDHIVSTSLSGTYQDRFNWRLERRVNTTTWDLVVTDIQPSQQATLSVVATPEVDPEFGTGV
jgi:hypothetical protein